MQGWAKSRDLFSSVGGKSQSFIICAFIHYWTDLGIIGGSEDLLSYGTIMPKNMQGILNCFKLLMMF